MEIVETLQKNIMVSQWRCFGIINRREILVIRWAKDKTVEEGTRERRIRVGL